MVFAPLLNPETIGHSQEVVAAFAIKPSALAGSFTGLATGGRSTEFLTPPIAVIRNEQVLAMKALTGFPLGHERHPSRMCHDPFSMDAQ